MPRPKKIDTSTHVDAYGKTWKNMLTGADVSGRLERAAERLKTESSGESRSVQLKSGGTLTLSATTKFMALNTTDRAFVFELIDKLLEYEGTQTAPTPSVHGAPPATATPVG